MMLVFTILLGVLSSVQGLNNGLALTPPMGWLTWERFRCITNCKKYPNECISANLIKRTADLLVSDGYLDAGYEYLGIDDCWLEKTRGPDGRLVPDRERFPLGMKDIADYVDLFAIIFIGLLVVYLHGKALKFGMYEDYGNKTCAGYPGVLGNEKLDINTFVEWEIDYLKLDGCFINTKDMDEGYPAFGKQLNDTGRQILYSCSWPAYQEDEKMLPNYAAIAENCNIWRNYDDIEDSYASLIKIIDWFGDNQDRLAKHAGPGHFNDPDMLLIGNFGLSEDQAKLQMAIWAILAAPLLISTDLATIKPEFKKILLNKDIIAVNQDEWGKQGLRIFQAPAKGNRSRVEVWKRELCDDSFAIAFVSRRDDGIPYPANFTNEDLQLPEQAYTIKDLYHEEENRHWCTKCSFETRINPLGVKFYKFVPKKHADDFDREDAVVTLIVDNKDVK